MPENSSEEEPSIEEILSSIRQIISDDDDDEGNEKEKVEEVLEDPVQHKNDDVLDLTEEVEPEEEPEPEPPEIDLQDIESEPEPFVEPEPEPFVEPESVARPMPSDILSSATQSSAIGSISKLATKMPLNSSRSYDGVTLEDIVRELLHPMLREWMDDNLPSMVERIVQKELEKLARRAMDD